MRDYPRVPWANRQGPGSGPYLRCSCGFSCKPTHSKSEATLRREHEVEVKYDWNEDHEVARAEATAESQEFQARKGGR